MQSLQAVTSPVESPQAEHASRHSERLDGNALMKVAEAREVSLREAAWLVAIDRVAKAESLRGPMRASGVRA